ncbi:hypothetical protein JCM8097_001339 [Rhodosporidiobolus ruineniae]
MKPREKGGVVDAKLNVYGIQGLKIADLSSSCKRVLRAHASQKHAERIEEAGVEFVKRGPEVDECVA